jgi:hypothetical protein
MTKRDTERTGRRQGQSGATGRFPPGVSGNPAGRPKGALNRSSRVALAFIEGESEALARKAVELALAGDTTALRVCIERLVPVARERSIELGLPTLKVAGDLPAAVSQVLAAVGAGELTPTEGERLAGLLRAWRESLEFAELERRVATLEAAR